METVIICGKKKREGKRKCMRVKRTENAKKKKIERERRKGGKIVITKEA